jgi:hypothetical protein
MKNCAVVLLLFLSGYTDIVAGEIDGYMEKCRLSGQTDYATEIQIVSNHSMEELAAALNKFYSDTTLIVRQQAYYLTYKKGIQISGIDRRIAVKRLVKGLADTHGGLLGQLVGYLQTFSVADFDAESQTLITEALTKINRPHYDDLVLLAGFVGVGRDEFYRQYLNPELPIKKKWNISLALARMGEEEPLNYCLNKIKKAPVNSSMVAYLLPDLVYTRQKTAVDYCVELLYSDDKLCSSPNPDYSETIPCAYSIIELLAPVVVGFPVQVDRETGLETDDYPATLQSIRDWFKANTGYQVKTAIF